MDARRLPVLLEAWDIIRPFYNPDAHKQFRYFRVNVELLGSVLEDSSIRGVRKANEENPDPQFIDREGNIHRMKYFTNAGADFVSDLLDASGMALTSYADISREQHGSMVLPVADFRLHLFLEPYYQQNRFVLVIKF